MKGMYHRNRKNMARSKLSVFDQHRLNIARSTLRMTAPMAAVMGGMTKEEARQVYRELTGRDWLDV